MYEYDLKEKAEHFASQMFSPGLFMIHDSAACGQDNVPRKG